MCNPYVIIYVKADSVLKFQSKLMRHHFFAFPHLTVCIFQVCHIGCMYLILRLEKLARCLGTPEWGATSASTQEVSQLKPIWSDALEPRQGGLQASLTKMPT
jgi:hypothetical protein